MRDLSREREREKPSPPCGVKLEILDMVVWWCVGEVGECSGGGEASRQPSANPRSVGNSAGDRGPPTSVWLDAPDQDAVKGPVAPFGPIRMRSI